MALTLLEREIAVDEAGKLGSGNDESASRAPPCVRHRIGGRAFALLAYCLPTNRLVPCRQPYADVERAESAQGGRRAQRHSEI